MNADRFALQPGESALDVMTDLRHASFDRLQEWIGEIDAERMMPCVMDDAVFADA
jgi:hypothetical protein